VYYFLLNTVYMLNGALPTNSRPCIESAMLPCIVNYHKNYYDYNLYSC